MTRIFAFGDSVVYGYNDLKGGWVARLSEKLTKKLEWVTVYNLGIEGDNSLDVLKRVQSEIDSRRKHSDEEIIIFSIGINDSYLVEGKKSQIDVGTYKKNLMKIFLIAKKYSRKIVFVGLTPVNEAKTTPVSWKNSYYKNSEILKYNSCAMQVCTKEKIFFIDVYDKLISDSKKWKDGLHPEANGHKIIAELVEKELIKNKLI